MTTNDAGTLGRDEAVRAVDFLLTRIASWTSANWQQHLRFEFGDECAERMIAAIAALRDGEGDGRPLYTTHVPCWALPAVESALSMLDLQGYWHSDLAAFRDWLKEKSV